MKDERKIYWTVLLLAAAIILFAIKAKAQCQTFTLLRLTDTDGVENRNDTATICLLAGLVEITEDGSTWQEPISLQSKGKGYTRCETQAGEYTFIFSEGTLTAVHLRSQIGADRSYLNPAKK